MGDVVRIIMSTRIQEMHLLVNAQVSGSERAGVIEGEVSTTVHNRSLVLTYERVIHQELYISIIAAAV